MARTFTRLFAPSTASGPSNPDAMPLSRPAPALATGILTSLALVAFAVHLLTAGRYGYFRDELYYIMAGRHPDWGYVDYPPMVAWLAWLTHHTLGDGPVALHVLPALAHAALVVLTGLMARELGGGRFAQGLAAGATLLSPTFLGVANLFSMDPFDQLWWVLAAYLVLRLHARGQPRLWTLVGVVVGLGLLTKMTMLSFAAALAVGLLLSPRRRLLATRWPWLAAAIALLGLLPYVGWQAAHGWPTLEFYHNYTRDTAPGDFLLLQVLTIHPLLLPLWVGGLVFYLVSREGRLYRALGWTYLVLLGVFLAGHAKFYFLAPVYPMLFAAGARLWEQRLRGRRWWRVAWPLYAGGLTVSGILLAILILPALPIQTYVQLTGGNLSQPIGDRVGWPELLSTVAGVYRQLPPAERAHTRILTANYGEAAAIDIFGPARGLPGAVSGHNNYYLWGPGPAGATVTLALGYPRQRLEILFADVREAAVLTNAYGVRNEENGYRVYVCRRPRLRWADAWPRIKHYNS